MRSRTSRPRRTAVTSPRMGFLKAVAAVATSPGIIITVSSGSSRSRQRHVSIVSVRPADLLGTDSDLADGAAKPSCWSVRRLCHGGNSCGALRYVASRLRAAMTHPPEHKPVQAILHCSIDQCYFSYVLFSRCDINPLNSAGRRFDHSYNSHLL